MKNEEMREDNWVDAHPEIYQEHQFETIKKVGMSGAEYVIIYCKKCGQVSFNEAKRGKEEIKPCK